ncbi:hypothetical protein FLAV_00599 [Flavobacteriales bacterium]|nr:hypothetical protein [Flavobacteriales bacterium]MCL4815432.1 DUF2480 family protein [Flavobacteriales bacterium]WKZ75051.1 MAG: DUF2480 family protein [Vicingaceae bacterium]GIK69993.1 MAG: hypothetical protein BroJett020_12880 [Bacteroidota bacterium]CAG0959080.1 hypothetical protein FLAV_00599 [Flavobacteriales bacterium]
MSEIVNRVAQSNIITLHLEDFYPKEERVIIDIKDQLWQGFALKEKNFREFIDTHNWPQYQNKLVAVHCSADAIVPTWAYMLVAAALQPFAKEIFFGNAEMLEIFLFNKALQQLNVEEFKDTKVVVKGCGNKPIPASAYLQITALLRPLVKSIMFGEACSTVPVYKKK